MRSGLKELGQTPPGLFPVVTDGAEDITDAFRHVRARPRTRRTPDRSSGVHPGDLAERSSRTQIPLRRRWRPAGRSPHESRLHDWTWPRPRSLGSPAGCVRQRSQVGAGADARTHAGEGSVKLALRTGASASNSGGKRYRALSIRECCSSRGHLRPAPGADHQLSPRRFY